MLSTGAKEVEQSRRLERGLIRVRWFAVGLGFYLVTQTNAGFPPHASRTVVRHMWSTERGGRKVLR